MASEHEALTEIERARQLLQRLRDMGIEPSSPSANSPQEGLRPVVTPVTKEAAPSTQETEKDSDLDSETSSETALLAVELRGKQQELELREKIANWIVWAVSAQLVVSALFFAFYLWRNSLGPDARIMMAWLGSSVIEVVGLAAIVTRNLFPDTSKRDAT